MPTWLGFPVSAAEYARRKAWAEEEAFQRRPTQGELAAPMIISDTQRPLMSMADGRIYDSKSEMRKGYKRGGFEEVGNDVPTKRAEPTAGEKARAKQQRRAAAARALSQTGFGAP